MTKKREKKKTADRLRMATDNETRQIKIEITCALDTRRSILFRFAEKNF